jgi:hypothetical protein
VDNFWRFGASVNFPNLLAQHCGLPSAPEPGRDLLGFGEGPEAAFRGAGCSLEVVEGEVADVFVVDSGGGQADHCSAGVQVLTSQHRYRRLK